MTTLADAYKNDMKRIYHNAIDFGELGTNIENEALFDLNVGVLQSLLKKAVGERRGQIIATRKGTLDPKTDKVCNTILETAIKDIGMALTGKEWEPKG